MIGFPIFKAFFQAFRVSRFSFRLNLFSTQLFLSVQAQMNEKLIAGTWMPWNCSRTKHFGFALLVLRIKRYAGKLLFNVQHVFIPNGEVYSKRQNIWNIYNHKQINDQDSLITFSATRLRSAWLEFPIVLSSRYAKSIGISEMSY